MGGLLVNHQKEDVLIHITQMALKPIDILKVNLQIYRTSLVDEVISSKEEETKGNRKFWFLTVQS